MIEPASGQQCQAAAGRCITCGDEAILMWVVTTEGMTATCRDDQGQRHEVAVDLLGTVAVGDPVLVHAGVAIGRAQARPEKRDGTSSILIGTRAEMARGGAQ